MTGKNVHTIAYRGGWANRLEGGAGVLSTHTNKEDAVIAGREIAIREASEHLIHDTEGRIIERNSYGNDPSPPTG